MQTFFRLLLRYHFFILFLIFESIAIYLVVAGNSDKHQRFLSSANYVSGSFYTRVSLVSEYFSLKESNSILALENAKLRNTLWKSDQQKVHAKIHADTTKNQLYRFFPARVIKNSINRQYNYLTLDKGSKDGVKPEMGVISPNGVVGIVIDVSDNFASVISVLNLKFGVSARFIKNNYFGSVAWNGKDYRKVKLKEIPNHVDIQKGDTLVTSSFSSIFPPEVFIGKVDTLSKPRGGNFYDITINLSTDLKSLTNVYIIENIRREEQLQLEGDSELTE